MIEVSTGTDKYQKQIKKGLRPVKLICVTDGAEMTFFDDGPDDPSRAANPGRAKLIAAASKRIVVSGKKIPVFYSTTEGAEVWDPRAGRPLEIAFYDEKAKAITEGFKRIRSDAHASHREQFKGEVRNLKAKKADA